MYSQHKLILCISAYRELSNTFYLINSKSRNIFKQQIWRFFARVEKLLKAATIFVTFVRPCFSLSAWNNLAPTGGGGGGVFFIFLF